MSNAVSVQAISKRYTLGAGGGYRRLSEVMTDRFRRGRSARRDELWALQDVSFDVAEGEVVGIIGRNGAGKSTLLKVLSRITEPTSGRAVLHGRVGSLLEVGTGFHPELTGRENIFLNGAVLGMRKAEIARRFDEIVAFAEVDRFLDTPVKRYSSGMYVRLAFAVAAHLEPEILVVDEVLAVGDTAFQEKCLGKMSDVARSGRTVLFVSHNMAAVGGMCDRAVLLSGGQVRFDGGTREAISRYLDHEGSVSTTDLATRADRTGSGLARIVGLDLKADPGGTTVRCGSELTVTIAYESSRKREDLVFVVGVFDDHGVEVFALDSEAAGGFAQSLPEQGAVRLRTGPFLMTPGRCYLNVAIVVGGALDGGEIADHFDRAMTFDVESTDFYGTGRMRGRDWSLCLLEQSWSVVDASPTGTLRI